MQILILAGGLGTRMRPLTETLPKTLLPVHDRPFAHYQMELLRKSGVKKVVYSIGFLGEQIQEALGDGKSWDIHIDYISEGPELKGTGGAVRLAYDAGVLDEVFGVLYGDSYLPISYRAPWEYFESRTEPALMTVFRNSGEFDTSNARFQNGRLFYDKKAALAGDTSFDFIDYGFSILRKKAVEEIPSQTKADLAVLFNQLSLRGALCGFEVKERFYEVGSPQGLRELEQLLTCGK